MTINGPDLAAPAKAIPAEAIPALTIYYDASCPLCATEMGALQRYAGATRLRLLDCSSAGFDDGDLAAAGVSRVDLMRCIHARDSEGRWLRGVEVFERAYRIAGLETVARVWGNHWLRPLWDFGYPWVARHRMLLSRLHLNAAFGWLIAVAARRAQRNAQACQVGGCK
jgi:predicted DCC family thiol-disulfide oxidoreductase YuxK